MKKRNKITIVGAGNVGETAAHIAAGTGIGDIILLDIIENLAEGKALDIAQSGGVYGFSGNVIGSTDWTLAKDSDVVIITSGMPRKPGMSRDELLAKNTQIVKNVSEKIKMYCPDAFVIVVCNPLDAMVYAASEVTGFDKKKVMGMAGALDSARFAQLISRELNVNIEQVRGVLMGGHGDDMVPLPRFTCVNGIPVTELIEKDVLDKLIEKTRKGGGHIVKLLGYSAYYAPASGAVKMAEAIVNDKKEVFSCAVWADKQYAIGGSFVGLPAIIGADGVEKVIELELLENEKAQLKESVDHVKELVEAVKKLL